ncbi:glutamate-rich protein 3 [Octodon degus]|uniref:Glutamate-rich protein 3 n=1 Tax=Octodon degus TaxID=10160 RepID=A0A6P6EPX4_OCTDE|nr:glutamate-rich protein 3 [Octodon degus]
MSLPHPAGLLAAYNSLTDKHLAGYFNNTRIRRHLLRSGLITRSGRILSEKEYKLNIMKRDHQKYIRECLAQAIFHKVLDMERYHQLEIKRKLETLVRRERIQRAKGEYTRHSVENSIAVLSPHPPTGPKTHRGHNILVNEGHSSPLTLTAPRPYTAPGNMQPQIRLQPLPRSAAVRTVPKLTSGSRSKTSLLVNDAPFPTGGKKAMRRFRNSTDKSQRMDAYQLPNLEGCMIPIPPPPPPQDGKLIRESRSETWRRRRLRPTTAPNGLEPLFTKDSGRIYKTSVHSNAAITMIYLGKKVHLSYDDPDFRDEIRVYQQHCGGENLCVYKGKLLEKETFQFISKRHHGFPFSLTFFLNGMQVNRLSSCCEYKHRKGSRLGGKRGYFGFVCVERASPCYKCIIAMGLDKNPSSLKPIKEKSPEDREVLQHEGQQLRKVRANWMPRGAGTEENKLSTSASFLVEDIKLDVGEVRTAVQEMEFKGKPGQDIWEDNQEYEEDFEVDEEKQDEKANEEGQAGDQMNGISKSPSEDEKDNLGPEKETSISSQEALGADGGEKEEGCSDSELEEEKQDTRSASSVSSGPYSSESEDDSIELGKEACSEHGTHAGARSSSSLELSESDEPGKSHLPIEESFEPELEDLEIREGDLENQPLPTKESWDNVLEEMGRGAQGIAENSSKKSGKHAREEEKEMGRSQLGKGSPPKVEDRQAGLPGVEEGASNRSLVVEERAAFNSDKESKQITQETHTLEKEATEAGEHPRCQDAGPTEDRGGAALEQRAGVPELPSREWEPTEQPALAGQLAEAGETPVDRAGADEEENGRLAREELEPTGRVAGEAASPAWKQDSARAELWGSPVQSSQHAQGEVTLRETATPVAGEAEQGAALSPAGGERPDEGGSTEKAPMELEGEKLGEDVESLEEAGEEEAALGWEEPATVGMEVLQAETLSRSSTAEAEAETNLMRASKRTPEDLPKKAATREKLVTETGHKSKDDRGEMLPEQSYTTTESRKPGKPTTSLRETRSEKKVVKWADVRRDEDALEEEQKLQEEERNTAEETRSEEQAKTPRNEKESCAVDPTETTDLTDGAEVLEDSTGERVDNLLEVTPELEKSPAKEIGLSKDEEGLREAGETEHDGWAEGQGWEATAPSEQGEGPEDGGGWTSEGPSSEPLGEGKVPDLSIPDTAQAEESAALDHGSFAVLARREEERPLQGPGGRQTMAATQEAVPERDPRTVRKFSEKAEGEDPKEEEEEEEEED